MVCVALTPGDPRGVGPELGLRVASARPGQVVLVGDRSTWTRAADWTGLSLDGLRVEPADPEADPEFGRLPEIAAVATAVRGCLDGRFDAVCTGPIHKADLLEAGFPYPGHTPYLAALCGRPAEDAVMMFAGGRLAVVLATVHVPLASVPGLLQAEDVLRAARAGVEQLQRGWGLASPRVAVCGLNPHAGEGGALGTEEGELIAPAVAALRAEGLEASGPWPADTVFARAARGDFDLVVAMYHDQGLIPVKTLDFGSSVNITAGLPIVRTSVDHGTARDLAGTGRAESRSMEAAVDMAIRLAGGA